MVKMNHNVPLQAFADVLIGRNSYRCIVSLLWMTRRVALGLSRVLTSSQLWRWRLATRQPWHNYQAAAMAAADHWLRCTGLRTRHHTPLAECTTKFTALAEYVQGTSGFHAHFWCSFGREILPAVNGMPPCLLLPCGHCLIFNVTSE